MRKELYFALLPNSNKPWERNTEGEARNQVEN